MSLRTDPFEHTYDRYGNRVEVPRFTKGDRVRVRRDIPNAYRKGYPGVVIGFEEGLRDEYNRPYVKVDLHDEPGYTSYPAGKLELRNERKFEKNDVCQSKVGEVVVEHVMLDGTYECKSLNGRVHYRFEEHELQHRYSVREESAPITSDYKPYIKMPDKGIIIADYERPVRGSEVIFTEHAHRDGNKGRIGTVVDEDSSSMPFNVHYKNPDGSEDDEWCWAYEVERIDPMSTSEPYIQAQDRIRIRGNTPDPNTNRWAGERGEVLRVFTAAEPERAEVKLDRGVTLDIPLAYLKRYKRAPDPYSMTSALKAGATGASMTRVPKPTYEDVVRYLSTDLGIDKKYISSVMEQHVEEMVDRRIDNMFLDGSMDKLVEKHVMEHIKQNVAPGTKAVDWLTNLVKDTITKVVTSKLDFGSIGLFFTPNDEKKP